VRHRNALLAQAEFGALYVDYYLHLAQFGLRPHPEHDRLFKDALAGLALHCASRPRNEIVAWTISLQDPLLNIFATGSNPGLAVAGQVFAEDVREREGNLFCADVVRGEAGPQRSVVAFEGNDVLKAIERFYTQSEQRRARYFRIGEEDLVMITAQPDCDLEWLESLTVETVKTLDQSEELGLLEQRLYHWECGCTQERMLQVLVSSHRNDPDGLFGDGESVWIRCPRCGSRHTITRESLEAFVAQSERSD
jgi:molecular chaperone Hsp33